jgi:hypothetical protein
VGESSPESPEIMFNIQSPAPREASNSSSLSSSSRIQNQSDPSEEVEDEREMTPQKEERVSVDLTPV